MMSNIIGIVGLIGSGKDTAGNILVDHLQFDRYSFATALKDVCADVFVWDRRMMEGDTEESRAWRNEVDQFWSEELNIRNFTPRIALQMIGTDLFRNKFNTNIWVASAKARLMKHNNNIVFTDCRFFNEINMIKEMGGTIIRIKRGSDPIWFDYAKENNVERLKELGVHASEYSWVACLDQVDITFSNDTTVDDLKHNIISQFS